MDVLQKVKNVATTCVKEWRRSASSAAAATGATRFEAHFTEGRRKQGVSREWFEYMFQCLSKMQCWETDDPWTHHVVYEILPENLEKAMPADHHIVLVTDAKGNDDHLRIATCIQKTHVCIGTHASIDIRVEQELTDRNYVKKNAPFNKMFVEYSKKFV